MLFSEFQTKCTGFLAYERSLARSSAVKSFIVESPCCCVGGDNNFGPFSYLLGQIDCMYLGVLIHFIADEGDVPTTKLFWTTTARLTFQFPRFLGIFTNCICLNLTINLFRRKISFLSYVLQLICLNLTIYLFRRKISFLSYVLQLIFEQEEIFSFGETFSRLYRSSSDEMK